MPIRPSKGKHTACYTCVRLKEYRRVANTREAQRVVNEALDQHYKRVRMDRWTQGRMDSIAELCASPQTSGVRPDLDSSVMGVHVDMMDQVKWKVPRCQALVHEWSTHWRPQLHCTGVLVMGIAEHLIFTDCDAVKSSDSQLTCVSAALS